MAYGTIKVDTITFTDAGIDKSVTISGLVQNPTFTGNVTVTGTVSGATANFVSGVFTTQISGATVTGGNANFTSGTFTNISGGVYTITSGVFALGTSGTPSISFASDPNTGIYSPGADQVAISTNGTGRLFVTSDGTIKTSSHISLAGASAGGARYLALLDETNSYTGSYVLQAGGGSAGFGGAITMYGHSHASYPGSIYLGTSSGSGGSLIFGTNNALDPAAEKMRLDSSGRLGLGTNLPDERLTLGAAGKVKLNRSDNATGATIHNGGGLEGLIFNELNSEGFKFQNNGTNVLRINSLGNVGIGTGASTPGGTLEVKAAASVAPFVASGPSSEYARIDSSGRLLVGTSSDSETSTIVVQGNSASSTGGSIFRMRIGTATPADGNTLGVVKFEDSGGGTGGEIEARRDGGTWSASSKPSRLVFSTWGSDGTPGVKERMRITNAGNVTIGTDGTTTIYNQTSVTGAVIERAGAIQLARSGDQSLLINRISNDGDLVSFFQDGTFEGSISVSGTTVSYNGAHLSRWSQLPSGAERTKILRGSVLSNLDEMCEWDEEDNEQLNRMKVSDVEGDKNVSGVFQGWDDDDDTYTDDFYCAMTGDFIIRIAEGVTVQRGDLLMSAGDGTAKPQDDDIIRSKTIAKVTSNHITCTYDDGSYCVPCVLMAC